ncbi:hypothetical protein N7492_007799 [Penicillium capsulatum]|uniref:Btz domain-containing protein n=1 Tax=Penicillium capsulatum TaxID=69766 RepID=A0A9W9LL71_9EURO|nr:hypothetical protein N7492_007799 [Penicillium capsulatum]
MAPRRRPIGASRRKRRDDDGEDEGSLAGDLEDDSLSEGSVDTNQDEDEADAEGSDNESEAAPATDLDKVNGGRVNGRELRQPQRHNPTPPGKPGLKATVSDTEAMLNGLKISGKNEEIRRDQVEDDREHQTGRTPSAPPTEPRRETLAAKKRREHDKYLKDRDQNPAFVPTRGSFFLHDKRTAETGSNGNRSSNKTKSRPYGLIVDGNSRRNSAKPDASEGQWTHDLHDTVAGDKPAAPKHSSPSTAPQPSTVPTAPRSSPPNRSFSSTTLVGNVPVVVFLPGMAQAKPFAGVPKNSIPVFLNIALPCAGISLCESLFPAKLLGISFLRLSVLSYLFLAPCGRTSKGTEAVAGVASMVDDAQATTVAPTPLVFSVVGPRLGYLSREMDIHPQQDLFTLDRPCFHPMLASRSFVFHLPRGLQWEFHPRGLQ